MDDQVVWGGEAVWTVEGVSEQVEVGVAVVGLVEASDVVVSAEGGCRAVVAAGGDDLAAGEVGEVPAVEVASDVVEKVVVGAAEGA